MTAETDTALEEQATADDKLDEVYQRAIKRFDSASLFQADMRADSLAARRFVTVRGAQWEGEWGEQFDKSIKIEVDKVGRGVRKIETDYRENRIIPDFRPDGPDADPETANMLDGLHRADNYRFKSQQARDNAVFEAITGGFGAYRLTNEWEDESDKDNDNQRINPAALIVDADQSVFFDPQARLYDKSDARYGFIRTSLTREAFEEDYDGHAADWPDNVAPVQAEWFNLETVAVAEYYEVEETASTLWIFTHSLSGEEKRIWADDLPEGEADELAADGWAKRRQRRNRRRVHKYILSGAEVLEDRGLIAGDAIPIVPVYGRRYFVENMERWKGYVHDKMDPQRLYNSQVSRLAMTNSYAPAERPIFDPEQMDQAIAEQWARANLDNLPYLLAHSLRDDNGNIIASGPIGYLKPPSVEPVTATLLQVANGDLLEDMEDGADTVKANTSAEAMDIAATRIDAKSGIYLDNIRQSVQREGEIYLGMAREVYSEPGRTVDLMTEDGDDEQVNLHTEVADDNGKHRIAYDLQGARYKVIASVTEATATRRDKTVRAMLNVAETAMKAGDQDLAKAAVLTATANMDGEGIDEFLAFCRKRGLDIGLFKPNDDEMEAMKAAAEGQQPDPMADLAKAEAANAMADAEKKMAEVDETKADTRLKDAKTAETVVKTRREMLGG